MQHRLAAGVIVEDQGRILMVRHVLPGKYDFWVAPGGGVQGTEELAAAAIREVREESGIHVEVDQIAYIEELIQPDLRQCKFWFTGRMIGGALNAQGQDAVAEHITEAAWLTLSEIQAKQVFPPVLVSRYWEDKAKGNKATVHLGIRKMEFW